MIRFTGNLLPKIIMTLLPFGAAAQSLHISSGARLVASGPVRIGLTDIAFTNDGSFTPGNSTVQITGARNALIGGTSTTTFSNLTINKANNSAQLQNDIHVTGVLLMSRGNLLLNNHNIDLDLTGTLAGEVNNRSILANTGGSVIAHFNNSNPPNAFNPGNLGLEITSSSDLGGGTVTRSHLADVLAGSAVGIHRRYDVFITSSHNSGLDSRLRFFYLDGELNGNTENNLALWEQSAPGNPYLSFGKDSNNVTANWVVKNHIDHLDHFTLGPNQLPGAAAAGKHTQSGAISQLDDTEETAAIVATKLKVYPNPAQDHFTLDLFAPLAKEVRVGLYDQSGHLLQVKQVHCIAGTNSLSWNISSYTAGIYYLSINGKAMSDLKIIKK